VTSLISRKSRLCFASEDCIRYRGKLRRVIVEVDKNGYTGFVRLEGTRQRYPFSFGGLYNHSVQRFTEKEMAARKAAKKAGRNAKP